jgi:hypothetical protein
MRLKLVQIFLLFILASSTVFAQNSGDGFEFYKVGRVLRADKQMKINAKISGSIEKMKISGTMDMNEKKIYDVTILEMNESTPTKMEVFVNEDSEKQDMKMVVAGENNNENNVKDSPLKGKTILCTNVNGTWEKSIQGVESPSDEQLDELNRFEVPVDNAIDFSKVPKDVKPGYVWNVGKDESAELFGSSEDNPFKDGTMKLKLKKVVNAKDERGYLWDVELATDGKNNTNENMNINLTLKGSLNMTNKNFTMDLKGPMTIVTKQGDMTMTMKGPAALVWKKYQIK